jgi:hypothetical protein
MTEDSSVAAESFPATNRRTGSEVVGLLKCAGGRPG